MRKPRISALLIITVVFAAFTLGFLLGRNEIRDEITVSVSENMMTAPPMQSESVKVPTEAPKEITFPIAINKAGKEEIMALPGIGDVLADRILTYREEHGSFSVPEELLNVEGLGKKRLEDIWDLITVGG